ncbi:MAG: type II toxin-antitoxin system VapC family toxin [Acidimicrobiia bacterium]|nr:type II toxin-antitoxin system VapC family toxin [Acidimicrobiia bacterium]
MADVLRRAVTTGDITSDVASLALRDLVQLGPQYFPFEFVADRVWALRHNVTAYDAWYVALAEWLDAPLATLDLRLAGAIGPTCRFIVPS